MGALGGINELDPLPSEIANDDLLLVGRGNVIYSTAVKNIPSRQTARAQMVKPVLADFPTWVNQTYADVTQLDDGVRIFVDRRTPGSQHCRVRPLPGGSWDVKMGFVRGFSASANAAFGGLMLRESATGKLLGQGWSVSTQPGWELRRYTSGPTNSPTNVRSWAERGSTAVSWARFLKNGSNIESYWSVDGYSWKQMDVALAITTPFTTAPDQWGFGLDNNLALPCMLDVIDWDE